MSAPAVLVAVLLLAVGWDGGRSGPRGLAWGLLATLFASVLPFAYIVGGVWRGRLTDHHVGVRQQRRVPLLVAVASAATGLTLLALLGAPRPVLALVATGMVGLAVAVTVSHWWKMSIHTAVATGAVVILVLVYGPALMLLWPLVGLVGWSRVRLGDHTVAQVVAGAVVGGLVAGGIFGALR